MSAFAVERLLARLYTDAALRRRFLADPGAVARQVGLDEPETAAFIAVDRDGLLLAAQSYARKRAGRSHAGPGTRLLGAARRFFG